MTELGSDAKGDGGIVHAIGEVKVEWLAGSREPNVVAAIATTAQNEAVLMHCCRSRPTVQLGVRLLVPVIGGEGIDKWL